MTASPNANPAPTPHSTATGGALITVTPNPAVDVTYALPNARWGEVNRIQSVVRRAGGKGVNVACVLGQLGYAAQVGGFLGGSNGAALSRLLESAPVSQHWVSIELETRCTTVVVDDVSTTLLNEPGPDVSAQDWARLTADVATRARPGDVVVLSGSCPPGTSADDVGLFLQAVRAAGSLVVVDTSGPLLLAAADAGADLLKPNHHELADAVGTDNVISGAQALIARGARVVAVSRGADGILVVSGGGSHSRAWRAAPVEVVQGNTTGAGDAAVAAFALALRRVGQGEDLVEVLPVELGRAIALSGAAVLAPVAGVVDLVAYERFLAAVTVVEISLSTRSNRQHSQEEVHAAR